MPTRPKRPCSHPGCPALADSRFCPAHAKQHAWSSTTTSAHARGYGQRWRRLRALILARDPVCTVCDRNPSTEVDHITAKSRGGGNEDENLRGICEMCHKRKTVSDRRSSAAGSGRAGGP